MALIRKRSARDLLQGCLNTYEVVTSQIHQIKNMLVFTSTLTLRSLSLASHGSHEVTRSRLLPGTASISAEQFTV